MALSSVIVNLVHFLHFEVLYAISKLNFMKSMSTEAIRFTWIMFFKCFLILLSKKILAHALWCTRNRLRVDLCIKVERFYNNIPDGFVCNKYYNDLWNKRIEKVFDDRYCYQGVVVRQLCVCDNIENVCSSAVFINFFGVIAIRIFFNIAKQFIFGV